MCFFFNANTKQNDAFKIHRRILHPIISAMPRHTVRSHHSHTYTRTHTHLWFPAIMMPFILIDRSYCKESKPAIISAALSEWDWLVSPSLWYGEERVYITLWALSLLQALTGVWLYRGSLSRFMAVTRLHARMKACNPAHGCTVLFPHRVCTYTDRLVNISLSTCTPACILTCTMWNTVWFPLKRTSLGKSLPLFHYSFTIPLSCTSPPLFTLILPSHPCSSSPTLHAFHPLSRPPRPLHLEK